MSVTVKNLYKRFGRFTAVDGVSFEVKEGELAALLGPSGAGKSTVLRIIGGLELPDSGTVELNGKDVSHMSPQDRSAGFVFQSYALFKHMTVAKNIAFGLEVRHIPKEQVRERMAELLGLVKLEGYGAHYPSQLSGGQRQRVALARALAPRPRVMLLDEPFGALDARVRIELREWIRRLHDEVHVTSIFVTHDQEEALQISDKIVVMNEGAVEQIGAPSELYDHPANTFVASFIGPMNTLSGQGAPGQAIIEGLRIANTTEYSRAREFAVYIRPHDLELSRVKNGTAELFGWIQRISTVGGTVKLVLSLDSGEVIEAELTRDQFQCLGVALGDEVWLKAKTAKIFDSSSTSRG